MYHLVPVVFGYCNIPVIEVLVFIAGARREWEMDGLSRMAPY